MSTREERIATWIGDVIEAGDRYEIEGVVFWGVFVVDAADTAPIAMFRREQDADEYRRLLMHNPESNAEYDVSPCLIDGAHRDNFEVPS